MSSKIEKMLEKLSADLEKVKLEVTKQAETGNKKSKQVDRPASIDICTKKSQLMLFTVVELKAWLLERKADKLSGLKKEDLIKLVVKKLKKLAEERPVQRPSVSLAESSTDESAESYYAPLPEFDDSEPTDEVLIAEILRQIKMANLENK